MILKSIHLSIPNNKPFDRGDWFEAFVGNVVLPLLQTGLVDSFWFTRYQDQNGKHARVRIKTEDYAVLKPHVDALIAQYGLMDVADEEAYDGGEFRGPRFVGQNSRNVVPEERQELIWKFLHAASALYCDTFSHKDADSYWYRELNHDRGNNIDGDTIESIHHLFCNMTAVLPRVELLAGLSAQGHLQTQLVAGTYRRWSGIPDELVRASQRVNF